MKPPLVYKFSCVVILFATLSLSPASADVPMIARVYYDSPDDIELLLQHYDVHEYNNTVDKYVLVSGDQSVIDSLRNEGWRVEVDQPLSCHLFSWTQNSTMV